MSGTEPICHYINYYKKFKNTYPVLLQLESILLKGKKITKVGAFIETMFLSEVSNLLLTAGHDADTMQKPFCIDIAKGGESFEGISGRNQIMTKDDLYLTDSENIVSSILNGPDYRTRITDKTKNALYFVYGVDGVSQEQIKKHFGDLKYYLSIFLPDCTIDYIDIIL
jgi:DNA/RNA-binding domain of Phe-tRNA-synthetase-like protein